MKRQGHPHIINSYAAIILAAGSSLRLGRPKQLLPYKGKTLLEHCLGQVKQTDASPVILVLGAHSEEIRSVIDGKGLIIAENPDWRNGLASSIACGIKSLHDFKMNVDGLILMVSDQPFADARILGQLVTAQQHSGKSIAACAYQGTLGTPAVFHKKHFGELSDLTGDSGAKKILRQYEDSLAQVPFKDGGIDIDTQEDYNKLSK